MSSIFSDRSKLAIATTLVASKEPLSFSELLNETQLTNGNLSSHLKKMGELRLIKIKKQFKDNRPLTTVQITADGLAELKRYAIELKGLLEKVSKLT